MFATTEGDGVGAGFRGPKIDASEMERVDTGDMGDARSPSIVAFRSSECRVGAVDNERKESCSTIRAAGVRTWVRNAPRSCKQD